MDTHIHPLSIPGIQASAKRAAERGIPHDEANHFNPHCEHEDFLHAAFKGAYEGYTSPKPQPQPVAA